MLSVLCKYSTFIMHKAACFFVFIAFAYFCLSSSVYKHNTISIFYKLKVIIESIIKFKFIIFHRVIVYLGFVKTTIIHRISMAYIPFSYVSYIPIFVVLLRVKSRRWLCCKLLLFRVINVQLSFTT